MSQDDEISALERAIREGDESKWDALDAALLRAGRLPLMNYLDAGGTIERAKT